MSNPRVLCLGEILFDCLADQLGLKLEEVKSWTPYPGGAPANVACALVKLGTPTAFIGAVGEDEPGNALVKLLEDVGVETTGVQRHPTAPTRQVYVTRDLSAIALLLDLVNMIPLNLLILACLPNTCLLHCFKRQIF